MNAVRQSAGWIVSVILVIVCGVLVRKLETATAASNSKDGEIRSLREEAARAARANEVALAKVEALQREVTARAQAVTSARDAGARAQLQTLDWMKRQKMGVIQSAFGADRFGPVLNYSVVIELGLTPEEFSSLNAVIRETKRRLDEAEMRVATGNVSADGKTFDVTIPPLGTDGDAAYSNLLGRFKEVLGADRFQLFNALAGDSFDREFDRFGLNETTYSLSLQPDPGNGTSRYAVKQTSRDADGKSTSWSSGTTTGADLLTQYPVLAHFCADRIK